MAKIVLGNIVKNASLGLTTAALIGGLGWQLYRTGLASAAPRVYTVVRSEKAFDKSGTLQYTNQYLDAVRSDGTVVHKFTSDVDRNRRIGYPGGKGLMVNDLIGKKSTYPKNFPGLLAYRNPDTSCSSEFDGKVGIMLQGVDYVGGHRALRFGSRSDDSRGWTSWYAADAGCALLQQKFEHETGVTVQELASFTLGEPDSSLFEVAPSVVESLPSDLMVQCRDGKCVSMPNGVAKTRMDKHYQAAQN